MEYRQSDIFICRPEERAPTLDPSILERTVDGIPDKPNARTMGTEVRVMFPSFIENAVTGTSPDAFD